MAGNSSLFSSDMVDRYDHPIFVHSHIPFFRIEGEGDEGSSSINYL